MNKILQIARVQLVALHSQTYKAFEYSVLTNSRINTVDQFKNIIVRIKPRNRKYCLSERYSKGRIGQV